MTPRTTKSLRIGTFQASSYAVCVELECYSRYFTSIILRVTYGKSSPTSIDDPEFVGVKQAIQHFIETMRPGAYLVDRFPWLKYVPGYGRRPKRYYEADLRF